MANALGGTDCLAERTLGVRITELISQKLIYTRLLIMGPDSGPGRGNPHTYNTIVENVDAI